MRRATWASVLIRYVGTPILAVTSWVLLGYSATVPLGAVYGWTGHPAMPNAPGSVYVVVYLVVLPVLCSFGAWRLVRRVDARVREGMESYNEIRT